MYFRARYYDVSAGEFISRDPLGYVDGMSQYRAYFVPGAMGPLGLLIQDPDNAARAETLFNNAWNHYILHEYSHLIKRLEAKNCPVPPLVADHEDRFGAGLFFSGTEPVIVYGTRGWDTFMLPASGYRNY